jgi:hypothetical protein
MKSNILSYFIKDIKDQHELAFYKQININNIIKIFYKDELLYEHYKVLKLKISLLYNFKTNIKKDCYYNTLVNYKMMSIKNTCVFLYYNKDNKINCINPNYIHFVFKHKKYLNKAYNIEYVKNHRYLFISSIKYYNCSKYIYKFAITFKYKGVQILIMNKYELHYINNFFNLFFV